MPIEINILRAGDDTVLNRIAPGVFDHAVQPRLVSEFLNDDRHHLAVAIDSGTVVGFASAVHYVHPDKPAELWINEVGVAPTHQSQGLGRRLLRSLFQLGSELGCTTAWALTERDNPAALRLYAAVGGVEAPDETVMLSFDLESSTPTHGRC
jgi:ribosomal protein S18 acetylase RimI-like enzyme